MRAMDLYSEKSARDGDADKAACSMALLSDVLTSSLMKEMHKGDQHGPGHDSASSKGAGRDKESGKTADADDFHSARGMGERDKVAFASLAFCSPLMMLGLGAGFAFADHLRMSRESAMKHGSEHRLRPTGFVPRDEQDRPVKRAVLSMPTERGTVKETARAQATRERLDYKNRKSNILFPSEQEWRPKPSPERSWVKASKLLKRKLALQDQLEKSRGEIDLSQVSAIVANIDKLDKELKKMGC